jgi:hypothetical protein
LLQYCFLTPTSEYGAIKPQQRRPRAIKEASDKLAKASLNANATTFALAATVCDKLPEFWLRYPEMWVS